MATEPRSADSRWDDIALALLVGIAVMGTMIFLVSVIRPPGLGAPPTGAIPLFVFTTTAAAISFVLLRRGAPVGYAAAMITGIFPVATVVLVLTGSVGEIPSGGVQPGPVVFTAFGVVLILSSGIAWRKRKPAETKTASSVPS